MKTVSDGMSLRIIEDLSVIVVEVLKSLWVESNISENLHRHDFTAMYIFSRPESPSKEK